MKAMIKSVLVFVSLFGAVQAKAVCDQAEYSKQYQTLRSIWINNFGNNCMNADQFLNQFGRTIDGLSSCRVDSRNQATTEFANWVRGACTNACEKVGGFMGMQLGFQVSTQICGGGYGASPAQGRVGCEERVAQLCISGLQDTVARNCPQAINTWQYNQAVQDCINWAQ